MNHRRLLIVFVFHLFLPLIISLSAQGILPQTNQGVQDQSDTIEVQLLPFEISGITDAFNQTFSLISESGRDQVTEEDLAGYTEEIDTLFSVIDNYLGDSSLQSFESASYRELDNTENRTWFYMDEVDQLQNQLSEAASGSEDAVELLNLNIQRWELTLEEMTIGEIPAQRLDMIDRTILQVDSMRTVLQTGLGEILVQQDRLVDKRNVLESFIEGISDQKLLVGENLFSRDMPGFFSELSSLGDTARVKQHFDQLKKSVRSDVEVLRSEFYVIIIFFTILFIFMIVFASWYKKNFARMISVEKFELSEVHLTIIYSPVISVIFILAVMIRFIFPELPHSFTSLNLIVLMVPMLIIVTRLFGSMVRGWLHILVSIYILSFVYELMYFPDIVLRIILLTFSVTGLLLFIWMIIRKPLSSRFNNRFVYRLFRSVLAFFALLLTLAIIGNLAGAFRMAEFFTLIPIQVVVLAIGTQVAISVADTIIFLLLASNQLQRLNVFRDEFKVIYKKSKRLVNFLLWLFFIVTTLNIFRIKDPFFEWGSKVLTSGWKIGAVDITPGSILVFVFVIWMSLFITRVIRHVLEKDVFARVSIAKGMPSTIILLVRIALITGGFFLAAAAAGMKLTNLSIVLGAFSVGIGFGLQNIFNNMVSGLILAFERPIKVGDTVQVGELIGVVRSIGLRSSTVRSFDGAEVIVPNGNLISNQMINWTLSDSTRRMDIRVGVAYGTDPEKVIEIMLTAAEEHKNVNRRPKPQAFFIGFGDSSLDFRVLAWADIEHRFMVESDLNVSINRKLKEAGIEIPFPQRDLHIRSDSTKKSK